MSPSSLSGKDDAPFLFKFPHEIYAAYYDNPANPTSLTILSALDSLIVTAKTDGGLAPVGQAFAPPNLKLTVFADTLSVAAPFVMRNAVSFFARNLVIPSGSAANAVIVLDGDPPASGRADFANVDPAADGQKGMDASATYRGTDGAPGAKGAPGSRGDKDTPAANGSAGWQLVMYAETLSMSGSERIALVSANGGRGQAGQSGQDGQDGGHGGNGGRGYGDRFGISVAGGQGGRGGDGGPGGDAGDGGRGGAGGSISIGAISCSGGFTIVPAVNGGQGGDAGVRGGKGGKGGNGGNDNGSDNDGYAYFGGDGAGAGRSATGGAGGDGGWWMYAVPNLQHDFFVPAPGAPGGAGSTLPAAGGTGGHAKGKTGPSSSTGATGAYGKQIDLSRKIIDFNYDVLAANCSPVQLAMTLRKAKLLYLMADPRTQTDPYGPPRTLLNWIVRIGQSFLAPTPPAGFTDGEIKSVVASVHGAAGLLLQMRQRRDFYGNVASYVPQGNFAFYKSQLDEMLGATGTFVGIENTYLTYFDLLQKNQATLESLAPAQNQAQGQISAATAAQTAALATANSLVPIIEADDAAVTVQHGIMMAAISGLEDQLAAIAGTGCVFDNLVRALNLAAATGDADTKIAQSFGTALQSDATMLTSSATGIASLPTQYLISRMDVLGNEVATINEGFTVSQGLITETDKDAYKLVMAKNQFEAMIDPYMSLPSAQTARQAMEQYVACVQQRNADIAKYNEAVAQLAAIAAAASGLQANLDLANEAIAGNADPTLPELVSFLANLYHEAREQVLKTIYLASRAYAFASLDFTYSAFAELSGLTDPSGINSGALKALLNDIITASDTAVAKYGADSETFPKAQSTAKPAGLCVVLTRGDHGGFFSALATPSAKTGLHQALFTIPPAVRGTKSQDNVFARLCDIRLSSARPWLSGVKTSSGNLRCMLTHLQEDTLVGLDGTPILFTREKIDRTFQYEIDGLYDPTKITIDSTFDKLSSAYSPPGPFATWRLTIDPDVNPGLDLSMADRLTVEFSGTCYPLA